MKPAKKTAPAAKPAPLALEIQTPRAFLPLLQPSRYKGAHGGRGSGKSHFFAELMIEENISNKLDNICLREVQKSLEFSCKKLLELKIQTLNVGSYFEVQDRRILTKQGGVIIFEGLQNHTSESIKSFEGFDRAWTEEAHSVSQTSLDKLRPTIRKAGSELWFSWNPDLHTDPVDAFFRGNDQDGTPAVGFEPPPESVCIEVNYHDNPWLPDELIKECAYDQRRDFDKYLWVWMGQYRRNSEARVFKNWVIEEFERPAGTVHRLGADWGFSVDPSVLVRCDIEGNRLYIDYEAYMVGCEIVNLPDLFDGVPESRKWFITADSARPETISYMKGHGYPRINRATKGPGSIEEGVAFLQSFDIVVHPRCIHTIEELSLFSYKVDKLTGKVLPILEDKRNHVIDALRYACEGARKSGKAKPWSEADLRPTVGIM